MSKQRGRPKKSPISAPLDKKSETKPAINEITPVKAPKKDEFETNTQKTPVIGENGPQKVPSEPVESSESRITRAFRLQVKEAAERERKEKLEFKY